MTALLALGSAVLAAGSGAICVAWLVTLPGQVAESSLALVVFARLLTLPVFIVSVVGVVMFGYGVIFCLGRLVFFRRPVLELGPEGVIDRSNIFSPGFVSWAEIGDAGPVGGALIGLTLKNERELIRRQNPLKRLGMRVNSRYFTGCAINIPLTGLPITEEALLAEIKPHLSPAAQKRLDKLLSDGGAGGTRSETEEEPGGAPPARTVLRIALLIMQWLWAFVLTIFFITTGSMLGLFGGMVGWSGLRALFGLGTGVGEWWHAPAGLTMIIVGVLIVFVWMTPAVRKLSGRDPIDAPYY